MKKTQRVALWTGAALFLLMAGWSQVVMAQDTVNVLVLKPGDAAATSAKAGPFLQRLEGYLAANVPAFAGKKVKGWISNTPEQAARLLKDKAPRLVIAPASFHLSHLSDATAVAQIPRFKTTTDRYYLIASKSGPSSPDALAGKTVHTAFGQDQRYLKQVVYPKMGFGLAESKNLADDLFMMTEGGGGPAAVLVDEETKRFFESDDMVWPAVKVIWKSAPLPRDLVLTAGKGWSDADRAGLLKALQAMKSDKDGAELLRLLGSEGVGAVDTKGLEAARKLYGR